MIPHIVNVEDNVLIGTLETDPTTSRLVLLNPRLCVMFNDPVSKSSKVTLYQLLGSPEKMELRTKPTWIYEVRDNAIIALYTRETTGLITPTPPGKGGLELVS